MLAGEPEKTAEGASDETSVAAKAMDFDFQKKMFEFEVMKYQQERGTVKTGRVGKAEVGGRDRIKNEINQIEGTGVGSVS